MTGKKTWEAFFDAHAPVSAVRKRTDRLSVPVHTGPSWTTDAPFRETESLIASRRREGIVSVEMEAVEVIGPFLTDHYGNPSSLHWAGIPAKDGVEKARGRVAGHKVYAPKGIGALYIRQGTKAEPFFHIK